MGPLSSAPGPKNLGALPPLAAMQGPAGRLPGNLRPCGLDP